MFKVENDVVKALSSSSIPFDNIVRTQGFEVSLVNITSREFPPSGFL
jgi:hypothetical protein